jgi:hypothetical protein
MRLKLDLIIATILGGILGYYIATYHAEKELILTEESLLDRISDLEFQLHREKMIKEFENGFVEHSDSVYTPTKKIKYKKAEKAKTKTDSIEFWVEKKIEIKKTSR